MNHCYRCYGQKPSSRTKYLRWTRQRYTKTKWAQCCSKRTGTRRVQAEQNTSRLDTFYSGPNKKGQHWPGVMPHRKDGGQLHEQDAPRKESSILEIASWKCWTIRKVRIFPKGEKWEMWLHEKTWSLIKWTEDSNQNNPNQQEFVGKVKSDWRSWMMTITTSIDMSSMMKSWLMFIAVILRYNTKYRRE